MVRDDVHLLIIMFFWRFCLLLWQVLRKTHGIIVVPLSIGFIRWIFTVEILRRIVHNRLRILLCSSNIWIIFWNSCWNFVLSISIIYCFSFNIKFELIRIIWLYQILPTKLYNLLLNIICLANTLINLWFALLFWWYARLLHYSCILRLLVWLQLLKLLLLLLLIDRFCLVIVQCHCSSFAWCNIFP